MPMIGGLQMITINIDKCTGCGACVQRCPQNCIGWESGEFGFRYPQIDASKCIRCGLCDKVCPIESVIATPTGQKVYAAVHKDPDILAKSTSGGAFSAIADAIFAMGGVVYGAAMQADMNTSAWKTCVR